MESGVSEGEVLVLGGGVAGLMAAMLLRGAGLRVVVVDKGRKAGGRLASRRLGEAVFDHGAPGFELGRRDMTLAWRSAEASGAMVEWGRDAGSLDAGRALFRGHPSMAAVGRHLADGLDVRLATEVVGLHGGGGRWVATTRGGRDLAGSALIVTAPVPQALAILQAGDARLDAGIRVRLEAVVYERCLAVMAASEGPPVPGTQACTGWVSQSIARVTNNMLKGISPAPSFTVHSTHGFALEHWDVDRMEAGRRLVAEVSGWTGDGARVLDVHGWRYSQAVTRDPCRCLVACESPLLVMAGDGFGSGGVEGAALSGVAAAEAVLARRAGAVGAAGRGMLLCPARPV